MDKLIRSWDDNIKKIKADWDITTVITGTKRKGKSTLGLHMAQYLSKKLKSKIWLCFSYRDRNIDQLDTEDLQKLLKVKDNNITPCSLRTAMLESEKKDIILADETIEFLQSGNWNKPDAKEFVTMHDEYGYKNLNIILLLPSFRSLQRGFREDRIKSHYWVKFRGKVEVYPSFELREGVYFKTKPLFTDTFDRLDEDYESMYRRIKEYLLFTQKNKAFDGVDIRHYAKIINQKIHDKFPDITQKERAEIIGVRQGTISLWESHGRY